MQKPDLHAPDSPEEVEKVYLDPVYELWSDLLLEAYDEAESCAADMVTQFWEKYSLLDATAPLYEMLMAAKDQRLPHFPGEAALEMYYEDMVKALAAFYFHTLPAPERVVLVAEEV